MAGAEEGLFRAAKIILGTAQKQPDDLKNESYLRVREILNTIVEDYPESDLAVRVLLQDTIDGLDVAQLDAFIKENSSIVSQSSNAEPMQNSAAEVETDGAPEAPNESVTVAATPATQNETSATVDELDTDSPDLASSYGITTANPIPSDTITAEGTTLESIVESMPARSEKEIVFDVQTELNRVGCGAGPADGVVGRRTRIAFRNFIRDAGVDLEEDALISEAVVSALKSQKGTICKTRTMASSSASALAGSWGFQGDCPGLGNRVIRNKGRMRLKYVGNNTLKGTATNQQGISGPATIQFQGGRTAATIIRFGFVSLKGNLTRSSRNMSISGTGTRRCKISAWKN